MSVTAPASVGDYTPATVVMKVTNKGSVATHGGSFDVLVGFTGDGGGIQYNGYSSTCQAVAGDVLCTVGTLALNLFDEPTLSGCHARRGLSGT